MRGIDNPAEAVAARTVIGSESFLDRGGKGARGSGLAICSWQVGSGAVKFGTNYKCRFR